jgi:hypothetical protein
MEMSFLKCCDVLNIGWWTESKNPVISRGTPLYLVCTQDFILSAYRRAIQLVVAPSESRTVRRAVKLPVEVLQHCLSVSRSLLMCLFMEEHCTICQRDMLFS